MAIDRPIHPDFQYYLDFKSREVIELFTDLRTFVLGLCPQANELLYHTHALTSVFSLSDKLSDGFVMLPIYTNHVNLGFHKGALLQDQGRLLKGTGKLIRHIPVSTAEDYRNEQVETLVNAAIDFVREDMNGSEKKTGMTISKIKR
jgi:hypothetical protein